jgi:hypothetical protein
MLKKAPKKKPFLDLIIPQLDSLKYTVIEDLESNGAGRYYK